MRFEWDRHGRLLKETNPNGNETRYRYDTMFSEPSVKILPEGNEIRYFYDNVGRMTEMRDALGSIFYSYNRSDAVTEITDRNGGKICYSYDFLGNKTGITSPEQYESGLGTRWEYDCLDHMVKTITPLGNVYLYQKGSDDRLLKAVNPNAYNAETNDGDGITFDYDATGRRIRAHYPDGGCERYFLDGNGNIIKRVHPEQYDDKADDGPGYSYTYDLSGHLISEKDPYGRLVKQYMYNQVGDIIGCVDARAVEEAEKNGHEPALTIYKYNLAGWMTEKREPIERGNDGIITYKLTTYMYDRMGNILSEKRYMEPQKMTGMSGATHTIRYEYDRNNRIVKVSDCTGAAMIYHYGKHGLADDIRIRIDESRWQETRYLYDAMGNIIKKAEVISDNVYAVTEYRYDRNGNIIEKRLPEGGKVNYIYDIEDKLIREEHHGDGIENTVSYDYDKLGNIISLTDNEGYSELSEYDLQNREIRHTAKNGGISEFIYDRNGRLKKYIKPEQYLSGMMGNTYEYDLCDRLISITSPDNIKIRKMKYNSAGDVVKKIDGFEKGISITYDLTGKQSMVETTKGSCQRWTYDAVGNVKSTTDGMGNRTEFLLDKWGRITGIKKADGGCERYVYDYAGNMTEVVDGNGNRTTIEYDLLNHPVRRTDPSGRSRLYSYDKEGRIILATDRNGNRTHMTYNMYGSLMGRTTVSSDKNQRITESFCYYPDGKLKSLIGGGMRYEYEYDAAGKLKSKSASGKKLIQYEYDLNGNRTSVRDVTGKKTEYRYNELDLLAEVSDGGKSLARYFYNPDNTLRRLEVGSGLITEYGYDANRNVISQKTIMLGMDKGFIKDTDLVFKSVSELLKPTVLVDNTYEYDANANCIKKDTLSGMSEYTYDAVNRLVKVQYPTCSEEYRYDWSGNRTFKGAAGNTNIECVEEVYTFDECNRVTLQDIRSFRHGSGWENKQNIYTYDRQGNLLSDGEYQYTYDVRNRLVQVTDSQGAVQGNHYDIEGLRTELEENGKLVRFIYDGDNAVVEADDNNTIRYIRGLSMVSSDSEAAKTYYHYTSDEMGSVTHITDENGTVLNTYEYDAFGKFTAREEKVENRFGFAGEQYDKASGMYYLRARYYNPVVGRFIQEDIYYGDGLNLYIYCQNNPIRYIDPSGNTCVNKQASLDYLKEKHPDWKPEQIEAEYRRVRDQCTSASEARKQITGTQDPTRRMDEGVTATFKYKDKFDEAEFRRQVQNQQDGLNSLTIQEYLENRERYDNEGRSKEGNAAQREAREKALAEKEKELRNKGKSAVEAKAEAEAWMRTQAALHDPDQIAGGNPLHVTGMGDRRVNSSLGSQWKNNNNAQGMYDAIKEIADSMTAEERATTFLNVRLIIE